MTYLTIPKIANRWINNGGSRLHVVVAVSVSLAESGGNTHAVSPSDDWGLWQINAANFGWLGVTAADMLDGNKNARVAIRMSGNGTNWGPWCTCWANPARDCGTGRLAYPQTGSAAYREIPRVMAALGGGAGEGSGGPIPTTGIDGVRAAWDSVKYMSSTWAGWQNANIAGTNQRIRELLRL